MRNKLKAVLIPIVFIVGMLTFVPKLLAGNITLSSTHPKDTGLNFDKSYNIKGLNPNYKGGLSSHVYVAQEGDTVRQTYCVQPRVAMASALDDEYYTKFQSISNVSLGSYTNDGDPEARGSLYGTWNYDKDLLARVLNYVYLYEPSGINSIKDFISSARNNMTKDEYLKVMAAQALVWEIRTTERTKVSVNNYAPDDKISDDLYDVLNESGYEVALNEYKRIINDVYYSYYYEPGNDRMKFKSSQTQAQDIALDIGKSVTITDSNAAFKYFKKSDVPDGLNVEVRDDSVTITASKAISQGEIHLSLKNVRNGGEANVYSCTGSINERSGCQDLAYGGAPRNLYLKVHTNKYSLRVKKVDESGNPLENAKFNICRDASCNTPINTSPLVTGTDGIVELTNLSEIGDYYIKEVEAPPGYTILSGIKKVTLTADTTAPVEFINKAKIVRLTKVTIDEKGNIVDLNDGCGTNNYTGPVFKLFDEGVEVKLIKLRDGEYELAKAGADQATTEIRTCNGKFSVRLLNKCNYKITEIEAPVGMTLPSNSTQNLNACSGNSEVSFTNGFTGLEFQKKNEEGEFLDGGKYALQKKINNVYKDVLLLKKADGSYEYSSSLIDGDANTAYIFNTKNGKALIAKIEPGEYRVVEKSAPEGYEAIEEKDSTAIVTINDSSKNDYYLVQLINKKVNMSGDSASAELVVTITTGRRVLNYTLIFVGLALALVLLVYVRRKIKK